MKKLKETTADAHRDIEECVPLMRADLTAEQYRNYLNRLLGYYLPLEAKLKNFVPQLDAPISLNKRFKCQWLKSDLAALAKRLGPLASAPLAEIHGIETVADAIGSLYVIEGSTLGGQIICRSLKANSEIPIDALRFLEAYAGQTGPMWNHFRGAVDSLVPQEEHCRVLAVAHNTFTQMSSWLGEFRNVDRPTVSAP